MEDVQRFRKTPKTVETRIKQTAQIDGRNVTIYMEQEPGASGKSLVDYYARKILTGYTFYGDRASGKKEIRANPASSAAEKKNINLVNGKWISDFLDELEAFPLGSHDDQVDALSGAITKLLEQPTRFVVKL